MVNYIYTKKKAYNALKYHNINDIRELVNWYKSDLLNKVKIGKGYLEIYKQDLHDLGLKFKDEDDSVIVKPMTEKQIAYLDYLDKKENKEKYINIIDDDYINEFFIKNTCNKPLQKNLINNINNEETRIFNFYEKLAKKLNEFYFHYNGIFETCVGFPNPKTYPMLFPCFKTNLNDDEFQRCKTFSIKYSIVISFYDSNFTNSNNITNKNGRILKETMINHYPFPSIYVYIFNKNYANKFPTIRYSFDEFGLNALFEDITNIFSLEYLNLLKIHKWPL